ncbi:cytochrome C oxidase subunit III [Myxococcus llanfairpwllgwyngyllgogerychwyrndrobwllllantysiliogogogochensis]|uniref:Cytochrome C oxidase subunit III n=1 Tax=Myxococcus llanfairpwllgwyngyllgogerychwyrndrobwllllantysiliogogogochensis TaxID=2590453 RepID=A0A540WRG2_9BACT|nr:cytochrome c oxidase subunit 3 [Myxococcus llanfairpwllgwyngyllgogerychwyrndrobwllllantysiliogogogochensis]TQF11605.1 cytochrome C oxidase subunit III [Myxococcus llanfairpwllgwyngyllgogerychwyrndrobwllllantysiliogogogochensis]
MSAERKPAVDGPRSSESETRADATPPSRSQPLGMTPLPAASDARTENANAEGTAWLGTVLGLAAWTMFFASLAFAVGWYRMREPWPTLPVSLLGLSLTGLLLLVGSAVLHLGLRRRESPWPARGALLLGLGFLALQAMWTHQAWWTEHVRIPEGGVSASAFHGLTALHALHVLVVTFNLFLVCWRHTRGADVRASLRRHVLGWHFVTAMWVLLFVAVYLP